MLRSHALAFFSALHARFGTLLAVIHLMFRAFLSACTADLGAKGTKFFSVITFLTQASRGARFAHKGTVRTSLDTGSEH